MESFNYELVEPMLRGTMAEYSTSTPGSKRNLKAAVDPALTNLAPATGTPAALSHQVGADAFAQPSNLQLSSPQTTPSARKRKAAAAAPVAAMASSTPGKTAEAIGEGTSSPPAAKKSRTNTPWSPAEEQRLKAMRDNGSSWSEIAKTFPTRTEGSVKKHWYKDMHYAEFAEDESAALLAAIKEYESSKWKVIGQKVGKPAKACEQYAKEHFSGKG